MSIMGFNVGDRVHLAAHVGTFDPPTVYVVQEVILSDGGAVYGLLNEARVGQGLGPAHFVYRTGPSLIAAD